VYSASLLASGKVLFAGTDNYNGIPSAAEIFDPADATFTAINRPSPSPSYSAATLLADGTVLITGRRITGSLVATDNAQNIAELYTPGNATFFAAGNIAAAGTSTLLPDGSVLIAGGSSAELFHPSVLIGAPKLFSTSADGSSQAAIWHAATGRLVSIDVPAVAGEILSMYTSGLLDRGLIPPQVRHRRTLGANPILRTCARLSRFRPGQLQRPCRYCAGTCRSAAPYLFGEIEQ
jgi:hypothetical protein